MNENPKTRKVFEGGSNAEKAGNDRCKVCFLCIQLRIVYRHERGIVVDPVKDKRDQRIYKQHHQHRCAEQTETFSQSDLFCCIGFFLEIALAVNVGMLTDIVDKAVPVGIILS